MEVIGKIKLINETQTFGSNGFRKRDLVVTTSEQYPQMILVEFIQDKCDILNSYNVGEDVKISINIRGREHVTHEGTVRYFNSIQGWRIERQETASNTPPTEQFAPAPDLSNEPDDLPF